LLHSLVELELTAALCGYVDVNDFIFFLWTTLFFWAMDYLQVAEGKGKLEGKSVVAI